MDFLKRRSPFDAITIWLLGTYMHRRSCASLDHLGISDPATYREHVQSLSLRSFAPFLGQNGAVQMVDRCVPELNERAERQLRSNYVNIATDTPLALSNLAFRKYTERVNRGVRMVAPRTDGLYEQQVGELGLVSAVFHVKS